MDEASGLDEDVSKILSLFCAIGIETLAFAAANSCTYRLLAGTMKMNKNLQSIRTISTENKKCMIHLRKLFRVSKSAHCDGMLGEKAMPFRDFKHIRAISYS